MKVRVSDLNQIIQCCKEANARNDLNRVIVFRLNTLIDYNYDLEDKTDSIPVNDVTISFDIDNGWIVDFKEPSNG